MITKLIAKISAKRVENATRSTIQVYLDAVDLALKPVPVFAGQVTEVLIKHKAEIEAAVVTALKIKEELAPIFKKFEKDMQSDNPAVQALWEDWTDKMEKLFK